MRRIPELLAPAGGRRQLQAAVNSGADAVYMGGSLFNARIKADNFTEKELREAVDFAHERGVKVYITVNTLIRDDELEAAFRYVNGLCEMGVDAVIVQDMGLARLIHKYLPQMPMHLSTQGTVYSSHAVGLMRKLGFSRIVPARELTREELQIFTDKCHEEGCSVEVFVHGAMCMCYSGQCHMSRILGKNRRSGNRGLCAQPCRLAYTDPEGRESYMLSPQDMCLLDRLPELCSMGVDSLKIEGRLKSAEYVAVVTSVYRKYLDEYRLRGEIDIADEDMRKLRQIYSRGEFTTGYFDGNPGEALLSGSSPKHRGLEAGRVTGVKELRRGGKNGSRRWLAEMKCLPGTSAARGDGVEIRRPDGHIVTDNLVTYAEPAGRECVVLGDFREKPAKGDIVWKISDSRLNDEAAAGAEKKSPVEMSFEGRAGERPVLEGRCVGIAVTVTGDRPCEKALKKATSEDEVAERLSKLGGTPFIAGDVRVSLTGDVAIPAAGINAMRREMTEKLLEERRRAPKRAGLEEKSIEAVVAAELGEELKPLRDKELHKVPLEEFRGEGTPYVLNVSKGALDRYIEENFERIADEVRESGIILGNPGWIEEFLEAGVKVYGDYGLNVYNEQARRLFEELGVEIIGYSHELRDEGIPLMITEHPVPYPQIRDRKGVVHKVVKSPSGDKYIIY